MSKYYFILFLLSGSILNSGCQEKKYVYYPGIHYPINNRDPNYHSYVDNLSWKDTLQAIDESTLFTAIDSSKLSEVRMEANIMIPIFVHKLKSVEMKDTLFRYENYRQYLTRSSRTSNNKYDQFLLKEIDPHKLQINVKLHYSHYHSIDDDILEALVIRQCKILRKGEKPNIILPDSILNVYQNSLLTYSKMSNQQAIEKLLYEIENLGQLITDSEDALLRTLVTYGAEASVRTFGILLDSSTLKTYSYHGKRFLLNHIRERAKIDLTISDQLNLVKYLTTESIYAKVLNEYRLEIGFIIQSITNESFEKSINHVGLISDNDTIRIKNQ